MTLVCPTCSREFEDGTYCPHDGTKLIDADASGSQDPLVGQMLSQRYMLERCVGSGGMGTVYRAQHVLIGKQVAVKVLRAELTRDPYAAGRFRREARSASRIEHENCVAVTDFGEEPDGTLFLVMEFLDGSTLWQTIKDRGPMPIERLLHMATQIAQALVAAHKKGVVHRDLKPENVMLVQRGERRDVVKVLDFGLAKVIQSDTDNPVTALTRHGMIFGTPRYMSPEQVEGGEVDQRADLYAFGVILYEMVTGKLPFEGRSVMALLNKHLNEEPRPPRERFPQLDIPTSLEWLILSLMSKKAEDRPQSAQEVLRGIEAVREEMLRQRSQAAPGPQEASSMPGKSPAPAGSPPHGLSVAPSAVEAAAQGDPHPSGPSFARASSASQVVPVQSAADPSASADRPGAAAPGPMELPDPSPGSPSPSASSPLPHASQPVASSGFPAPSGPQWDSLSELQHARRGLAWMLPAIGGAVIAAVAIFLVLRFTGGLPVGTEASAPLAPDASSGTVVEQPASKDGPDSGSHLTEGGGEAKAEPGPSPEEEFPSAGPDKAAVSRRLAKPAKLKRKRGRGRRASTRRSDPGPGPGPGPTPETRSKDPKTAPRPRPMPQPQPEALASRAPKPSSDDPDADRRTPPAEPAKTRSEQDGARAGEKPGSAAPGPPAPESGSDKDGDATASSGSPPSTSARSQAKGFLREAREAMHHRDHLTAGKMLWKASALLPRSAQVQRAWANFHFERGRYEAAQSAAQRAVQLNPNGVGELLMLGQVAYERGDHELACRSFGRVLKLRPEQKQARRLIKKMGCP